MKMLAHLFRANRGRGEFRAEGDVIWMYDMIAADDDEAMWLGGISPRQFIAALAATSGPVTLRINSPGGSCFGAQAMVVAMRAHPHPIMAQVDSLAASAASVIAAEAAECAMAQGAQMMIHKCWSLVIGNADDLRHSAGIADRIDGEMAATYARRAKADDAAPWMERMAAETWYTAAEAVAAGLADRVIATSTQRAQARWDLSAFARAPVPELPLPELPLSGLSEDPPVVLPPAPDVSAMRVRQLAVRLAANPI